MANFEREVGIVGEVRNVASEVLSVLEKAAFLRARWDALGSTFLDAYYATAPDVALTKQNVLDALTSFSNVQPSAGDKTNLHRART